MATKDELIEEAIELLQELYPERLMEITTSEEKLMGNSVFADGYANVIIEFITSGQDFKITKDNDRKACVRLSKLELVDGHESRMSTIIDLEDIALHVIDEYRLLEFALKAQTERHGY